LLPFPEGDRGAVAIKVGAVGEGKVGFFFPTGPKGHPPPPEGRRDTKGKKVPDLTLPKGREAFGKGSASTNATQR
jgi:hypothetical protein